MRYISLVLFIIVCTAGLAQQEFVVEKGSYTHGKGLRNAIHVKLEPEAKEVSGEFKSFLKDKYDIRLKGSWKERRFEETKVKGLSDSLVNAYFIFKEVTGGTEVFVVMKYPEGKYLTTVDEAKAFTFIEEVMHEFLRGYLPGYYNDLIEETNKEIGELEKTIQSTTKSIEKNEKAIEKNKEKIRDLEDDIKERERENEDLRKQQGAAEKVNTEEKARLQERKSKLEGTKSKLINFKN